MTALQPHDRQQTHQQLHWQPKVDIGLDHDCYKSSSDVNRNTAKDTKKWTQWAMKECDKINNKEVTKKKDFNTLKKSDESEYKLED
jgi:hypothetical protein